MKESLAMPFGLLFEERPVVSNLIMPIYDEDEDISIVVDENGHKIPSVEYRTGIGTKTATSTIEDTDDDEDALMVNGTRTVTETQAESADSDENVFLAMLATKTETFVQSEDSDKDPTFELRQPYTTGTATKTSNEDSDTD